LSINVKLEIDRQKKTTTHRGYRYFSHPHISM